MTKAVATKRRKAPRRRRPVPVDPVTAYAQAVVGGQRVVGRAVRLACERHLRDLARQRTPDFPFYFSPAGATHIIDFFPEFLTLEDGEPFVLVEFMQFCLGSVFGWRRMSDDGRRFQTAYIETAKGSGKTPTAGGVGLYGLAFDGEQAAQIYSAAFDKGQASLILQDAIRMAEASPDLLGILDVGKYNIAHPESGSFFRAVSSQHQSKSGPRPHIVLVDELHEHRDATVVNKMKAGFKFRKNPLLLEITNSGHDRRSVCWQHHEKSIAVLEGVLADEEWFAYVCQLDPCPKCFAEGHRQPNEGCPDCDSWTDERVWPKANPSIGVTIQPSYLRKQVNDAQSMPADQALVKRLNFCIWTESHQVWIPSDVWGACRVERVRDANPDSLPCALGGDLSSTLDLTSFAAAIRIDDAPGETVETVEVESLDPLTNTYVKRTLNLNFCVEFVPFFWIPEAMLLQRIERDRVPYDVWRAAGLINVTPGNVVDYDAIYDALNDDIAKRFKPREIGMDPWNATGLLVQLRDVAKLNVVEVPQGKKLSAACKLFEALVKSKRARHNGHPILAWNVANGERQQDRFENIWVEKPLDQTKRIDGLMACVIALDRLMQLPEPAAPWTGVVRSLEEFL